MSGHTPGPWLLSMIDPIAAYEDDCAGRAIAIAGSPHFPPRDSETTLANMRLIIAAPDLLAALDRLLYVVCENDHEHLSCVKQARAAIAKATEAQS